MMGSQFTVTVFGSSRPRPGDPEYTLALDLGRELARAGFVLCNGGFGGTMEASAMGAKEFGGRTIGVITEFRPGQSANRWIDTVIARPSLMDRMMELIAQGEAYVVLKGGTGTLLELSAVWELMNKSLIDEKPIMVLGDFWNGVVETLKDELAWEGLEPCTRYVSVVRTPRECAEMLRLRLGTPAES
jgi:uncharacterized protein (TIGR00725 family)